jgi:hypothetical protein
VLALNEILDKLETERERYEWKRMLQTPWFTELTPRLKEFVISLPPIYLYELQGHLVEIYQYEEDKQDPSAPITVTANIKPEWNSQYMFQRMIRFVPASDLKRVELVRVARAEKILSGTRGLPWMKRLIDTTNKEDVLRGNKQ